MIIVFKPNVSAAEIEDVKKHVVELGYDPRVITGVERTIIGAVGDELSHRSLEILKGFPCIENVLPIQKRYKLATRNTLDLGAVAVAKEETHLPVIVDPSHAAGVRKLVLPLAKAAVAAGADGLIIEAHPDPVNALSDAPQQFDSAEFGEVMKALRPYIELAGKHME